MSGWEDRIWPTKDGVGKLPYRSRVPELIAGVEFTITELQRAAAGDCQTRIETWCADTATNSCDQFLQMAEAAGSSTIEGITASPKRIVRAQATGNDRAKSSVKAVLRNISAVRQALDVGLREGEITVDDICSVHAALTDGLPDYPAKTHPPGELRTEQNWIGGSNRLLDDMGPAHPSVKFVPPHPELVRPLLDDLLLFAARTDIHPLPQSAIFHARFEEIHPFIDGNGRTGRALVHALWAKRGMLTRHTSIPVSSGLARHVGDYEDALVSFQTHEGDTDAGPAHAASQIVDIYLISTSEALTRASHVSRRFVELQTMWRSKLSIRRGSLMDRVVARLPEHPVVDTNFLAQTYGVTQRQASRVVASLVKAEVMVGRNIGGMRRGYEVTDVLDVADAVSSHQEDDTTHEADDGKFIDESLIRSIEQASGTNDPAAVRHTLNRDTCGAYMPLAKSTCVLVRGHHGAHRSRRPWRR